MITHFKGDRKSTDQRMSIAVGDRHHGGREGHETGHRESRRHVIVDTQHVTAQALIELGPRAVAPLI